MSQRVRNRMVWSAALAAAGSLWAADGTWTATSGGNWSEGANWQSGAAASGSGSTAYLSSGSGTINNDATDLALRGLQLAGGSYTLAGNTIALDAAGFVTVLGGSQTVSAPLTLNGATALSVASAQTLALNGLLSGSGSLTVRGGRVVLGNADNAYTGPTVLVTGIVELASVDALGDSPADPANLVLGEGLLRYTGPSATLSRGITVAPTNSGNRATVFDVTTASTTLGVAGKVVTANGSFIKTGEGTLAFTYPGYQEIGKNKASGNESIDPAFDANGSAGTNGYVNFTVDKGRVVLGAAGQTNQIVASAWVGSRTLASPRLDVTGGVTRFTTTYFTISRGTGTSVSPQRPSVYVSNGALLDLNRLVMGHANGVANYYCEPYLHIDGATCLVQNDCYLSEDTRLYSVVTVTNNGLFQCNSTARDKGLSIAQTAGSRTYVNVGNASTGSTYQVRVGRGGNLNVTQNGVFELDTSPTNAVFQNLNLGTVRFNAGTLKQRTEKLVSDWFVGVTNLLVGSGGMTLNVGSHALLDAVPKADASSPGGSLTKAGNGTLALRANALNIQVNGGTLSMAVASQVRTNGLSNRITVAPGASLELAAAGAAADTQLTLNGSALRLRPHSLLSTPDFWTYYVSNAYTTQRRSDGMVQLTPESGVNNAYQNQKGAAYLLVKKDISKPWSATFAYTCWSIGTDPADGFAFVIHNDPRGANAVGASGSGLGYYENADTRVTNSVCVGLNATGHQLRFGRQGSFVSDRALSPLLPKLAVQPVKTTFTVTYNGAGLVTVQISRPGTIDTYQYWAVNIPAEVGASEAWVGFTAGTGTRYGQHTVSDFHFDNSTYTPVSYGRYGGRLALGSGETLSAVLNPALRQRGFVLGSLAYADQSVIDAGASASAAPLPAAPAPTLSTPGLWKLNQTARWKPDGRLALSTNAVNQLGGTAFTTNAYPVTGSWHARFGFDLGDATATPADYVAFVLQSASTNNTSATPNPGLSVMWRYYLNAVTTTHLYLYTNNVQVVATTNIAPVSLRSGGHAVMDLSYDAATRALTVTTSQAAGTNVCVFSGVDMLKAVGSSYAYLGFAGGTGGLFAENIVSDLTFTSSAAASTADNGYLAFDRLSGSGTLVKRGDAALGILGDRESPTSSLSLRLEKGGLLLRKNGAEAVSSAGAASDWVYSSSQLWGNDNTLLISAYQSYFAGTAMSARRVRVSAPWTATFRLDFGRGTTQPADAFSLFFHNDPSRLGQAAGTTANAAFDAITKSIGLRWCFYPNHSATYKYAVGYGRNGVWNDGSNQSYAPAYLTNGVVSRFVVKYAPSNATLTSIVSRDAISVTNVFTGINIATDVADDYAYVGFGSGTGGSYQELRISDFKIAYDTPADPTAAQSYLASLTLPAASTNIVTLETALTGATFPITAATVGDGATFGVAAAQEAGTLAVASVTQSGDASYPVASGCTLSLANVTGGDTLTKSGSGTLALAGAAATYSGDTLLASGTLALSSAALPKTTDLYVTGGATLNLGFTGKQYVHKLFVDGVLQRGGAHSSATDPWLTGTGTLFVLYPPFGSLISVK